jgi:hypothetical protein
MFTQQWTLCHDALNGTGGFDNGDKLIKYPRETDDKFKKRKEVAYYVNHMKRSCHRFASYLSKQPASRTTKNKLINALIDNCDQQGNHINQFMQSFSVQAKAKGCGLVLVDMPKSQPSNQSEQLLNRNLPYFAMIPVEQVTDYEIDNFGNIHYIEFSATHRIKDKTEAVTRRYDTQGWSIKHQGKIIDQGGYALGRCPVISFGESKAFPELGTYYQIAELSKRLYNAQSELDEILRGQTFSLLTYQVPTDVASSFDAASLGSTIGTQNMLIYHGEQPGFTAPDSGPASTYQQYIKEIEERINVIANNVDLGAQQQSGAALSLRFQNMNAELLNFARRLEDFERKLFELVALWLGVNNDVEINYPTDFNIIDKQLEIEVLEAMQRLNAPPSYISEKMRQIIQADLTGISAQTEALIMGELDEANHERQP